MRVAHKTAVFFAGLGAIQPRIEIFWKYAARTVASTRILCYNEMKFFDWK
jgi:hypothetical protein